MIFSACGSVRDVRVGDDGLGAFVIDLSRLSVGDIALRAARECRDGAVTQKVG